MNKKFIGDMALVLCLGLCACGSKAAPSESASESVSVPVSAASESPSPSKTPEPSPSPSPEPQLTEQDIQDAVAGLEDVYVLQAAKDVNLLSTPVFDGTLVKEITVDAQDVDYDTPGQYRIIYQVTVYPDAIDAYNEGTWKAEATDTGETQPVPVERAVTVVTQDEATNLADQDMLVRDSGNAYVPKSDGTAVTIPEPSVPASVETTGGDTISAETGKPIPEPTASPEPSPAASQEPTQAPSQAPAPTATPKPTPKPAAAPQPTPTPRASTPTPTPHTHTWVTVEATGHYEKQQTGTQTVQTGTIHHEAVTHEKPVWKDKWICRVCGATFPTEREVAEHEVDVCEGSYKAEAYIDHYETVIDQEAWDEPVYEDQPIYTEVWVEDTPSHQKCSDCGATK